MDLNLFKRLVDEAAELQVPELCPNGFGELLTMRNLGDYLGYIREKQHPFWIAINSNGYRLDDEKIETFLDTRVDFLNITIDGATAETFEAIRLKLKFADIEDNIRRLLKRRAERGVSYPEIRVGMVLIKQNEHEAAQFLERWRGVVDHVGIGPFTNRAASRDPSVFQSATQTSDAAHACVLPFRELNIWADGRAVLCCDDWNEDHPVGDFNTESLRAIWNGPALSKARELHMAGRGSDVAMCAQCSFWRAPGPGVRLWA
jgi:MoaA/NifB/PqqE/SkfB family radical SAM enzyme